MTFYLKVVKEYLRGVVWKRFILLMLYAFKRWDYIIVHSANLSWISFSSFLKDEDQMARWGLIATQYLNEEPTDHKFHISAMSNFAWIVVEIF